MVSVYLVVLSTRGFPSRHFDICTGVQHDNDLIG